MEAFVVQGGTPLAGELTVSGAKNVALKVCVASLLTSEPVIIHNVPHIRDVFRMLDVIKSLGVVAELKDHTLTLSGSSVKETSVPLDVGARLRTSSMVIGPMLARFGEARIPNPGGCRIGARPIDRHIEGLQKMGASITYYSDDGFFHAKATKLKGIDYTFEKNTHTGTETLLLAAVLAQGTTTLRNAAEEIEVDDLIHLLNSMGANVTRSGPREITIVGVSSLHGTEYTIMADRNEEVTFAIAAAITGGKVTLRGSDRPNLTAFLTAFQKAGGTVEELDATTTRYGGNKLRGLDVVTKEHPGFMTDWQAPWAVFMTQAEGISTIHETVFESRFSYVSELAKMGAKIDFYDPEVPNPESFYNFNWKDRVPGYHQGIRITGPTKLHNAVIEIDDLRAGATLVLAALTAHGESYIRGIEQIDRGYEKIDERLAQLGASIKRVEE